MSAHFLRRGVRRFTCGEYATPDIDSETSAWVARIAANGGIAPSEATQRAASLFWEGIKGDGLGANILALNFLAPDTMIAARTPFIQGPSSQLWGLMGSPSLSVNGLTMPAASTAIVPGFRGTDYASDTNLGLVLYRYDTPVNTSGSLYDAGYTNNAGTVSLIMAYKWSNAAPNNVPTAFCYNLTAGQGLCKAAAPLVAGGYLALQRTAANACSLYFANGSTAHSAIATITTTGSTRVAQGIFIGSADLTEQSNIAALGSLGTFSCVAMTNGLSAADSANLAARIQALRVALLGGYV